ncbi:MAG: hypothetical protein CMJ50_03065 [Planctomycetaceae bacterium]|nr:hypothetical protein [Planctomycetaceae bacterium]
MTIQLVCHHHHRIELSESQINAQRYIVCPLCGCASASRRAKQTAGMDPLSPTMDIAPPDRASQIAKTLSPRQTVREIDPADEIGHEGEPTEDLSDGAVVPTLCNDSESTQDVADAHVDSRVQQILDVDKGIQDPTEEMDEFLNTMEFEPDEALEDDGDARPSNALLGTMDFESTPTGQLADPESRDSDDQGSSFGAKVAGPAPNLPNHTIGEELGRGGMGVVYRCYDERSGRHVALKTLQQISPADLQRFKREFRSLADLAHPNVVALYELLGHGDTLCFTMEYLEGVDFLEYVWSGFDGMHSERFSQIIPREQPGSPRLTPRRIKRLYEALKQLAAGLGALHQASILHRDVKPSNVMVTTGRRLVLLDFGLAAEIQHELRGGGSHGIQGTPEYMSPEQAANQETLEASDWYAVGVMLYEILTGFLPITGETLNLLFKKQHQDPVDPHELEPSAPPELCRLCMALLDRDPSKRPSAVEVLQALNAADLAEALRMSQRADNRRSVELVGRERHLSTLKLGFERMQAGEPLSIFVHGRSGMGKSVLVQRFLQEVRRLESAVVLEGRCYEQESVPFKALDSLVDDLSDYLMELPRDLAHEFLPRDTLALFRVFPVLGQLKVKADTALAPITNATQQEVHQRALTALRELFQNLGRRYPLVLYIDDLQWGDVDSAVMLVDVLRPPQGPRLLLLGSYRSEHEDTSPCLLALRDAYKHGRFRPRREELGVESLTMEEATSLAAILLREVPGGQQHAEKIGRESAGWPFFVWELVQHIKEDAGGTQTSLELDEVIWTRVNRLPAETRQLLEVFAVSGCERRSKMLALGRGIRV